MLSVSPITSSISNSSNLSSSFYTVTLFNTLVLNDGTYLNAHAGTIGSDSLPIINTFPSKLVDVWVKCPNYSSPFYVDIYRGQIIYLSIEVNKVSTYVSFLFDEVSQLDKGESISVRVRGVTAAISNLAVTLSFRSIYYLSSVLSNTESSGWVWEVGKDGVLSLSSDFERGFGIFTSTSPFIIPTSSRLTLITASHTVGDYWRLAILKNDVEVINELVFTAPAIYEASPTLDLFQPADKIRVRFIKIGQSITNPEVSLYFKTV